MENSVSTSPKSRNQVLPPGPLPLQSYIHWKAHKDKGKIGKEHQGLLQGKRDAKSSI